MQRIQQLLDTHIKRVTSFWKKRGSTTIKISLLVLFVVGALAGKFLADRNDEVMLANSGPSIFGVTNVDEIAGARVAAIIAGSSRMIIADNVINHSDSIGVQVEMAGTDLEPYLDNLSLVATDTNIRSEIVHHTVKTGETIPSIARDYGVTSDTIRWANDLSGDLIGDGKRIKILPVSGVEHTVQSGDTVGTLAQEYRADATLITTFNNAEVSGLTVGQRVIIPGGRKPTPVAAPIAQGLFLYGPQYGSNGYAGGYCTWHAARQREQAGNPIPRNLGHAVTWRGNASVFGMTVSSTPRAGAVVWDNRGPGIGFGFGHVAYVEKAENGGWWISHMNYPGYSRMDTESAPNGGWGVVSYTFHTDEEVRRQYSFIY